MAISQVYEGKTLACSCSLPLLNFDFDMKEIWARESGGRGTSSDTMPYLGIKQLGLQALCQVHKLLSLDATQGNYLGSPAELRNSGFDFGGSLECLHVKPAKAIWNLYARQGEKKMLYENFPGLNGRITILKITLNISKEPTRNGKKGLITKEMMISKSRNAGLK